MPTLAIPDTTSTLVSVNNPCKLSDVQIDSIIKQDGSGELLSSGTKLNATACLGAYAGNDETNNLGANRGFLDEGFLNDTNLFPEFGAFLGESDMQDLRTPGEFVDPGWIFVKKIDFDGGDKKLGTITGDAGSSFTFEDGILSISQNAGGTSGTFTYKPPQTNPEDLLQILGTDKFFDQAAVVFKAGNSFAIYNFTLADLMLDPVLGTNDENYQFSGTWDISQTLLANANNGNNGNNGNNREPNGAGLSHVSLWLRDPTLEATEVPVPATLLLLGVGLILVSVSSRRRAR